MQWKKWLYGLISAVIGSAANSITVMIVEPTSFNLQEGLGKLGTVAAVSAIVAAALYLKQSPLPPVKDATVAKAAPIAVIFMATALIIGCATNMPSKYDTYEGCLICDIAHEKDVRLEDIGNMIRVAGAVARAEDIYTRGQAIDALVRIRTALEMPVTGVAFVEELQLVAEEYREVVEIAMSYAPSLAVPQLIDDQSVKIMLDFVDERIARLQTPD